VTVTLDNKHVSCC